MYVNQHLAASKRQKRGCYFFPPSALRNYIYLYSPNPKCDLEWLHTRENPSNPTPALHLHDFQVARFKVLQVFQVLLSLFDDRDGDESYREMTVMIER